MHYFAARDPDPEDEEVVLTWPEGNAWLTRAAGQSLLHVSWASLRDAVLRELRRLPPGLGREVRSLDIMRYGHAMVRPEVGFARGPALAAAGAALPVHLAQGVRLGHARRRPRAGPPGRLTPGPPGRPGPGA